MEQSMSEKITGCGMIDHKHYHKNIIFILFQSFFFLYLNIKVSIQNILFKKIFHKGGRIVFLFLKPLIIRILYF